MKNTLILTACFFALISWLNAPAVAESPYDISIGGQYRVMTNVSNFPWHPLTLTDDQKSQSFVNQRLRTWFDVEHTSSMAGAFMQIEIGHNTWGEDREFTKTHSANGDDVGLELRRGYVWLKPSDDSEVRVGVQAWSDAFGDVLASGDWDFNTGGVLYKADRDSLKYSTGLFILGDTDVASASDDTFLFTLDGDYIQENWEAGASIYYLNDRGDYSYGAFGGPGAAYNNSSDVWLGVRGAYQFDMFALNGFLIYNTGETETPDWDHNGVAIKLGASADTPVGALKVQFLYASGDDDLTDNDSGEFRTIAQSERDNFGSQGYWSFLGISSPRGSSDVNDLGIGLQNRGLGLITLQAGLDIEVKEDLTCYVATGWLQSAEDNPVSNASDMGIEFLGEAIWNLYDGFNFEVGAAYLFTGDFYEAAGGSSPDDLFELFARLQLEF